MDKLTELLEKRNAKQEEYKTLFEKHSEKMDHPVEVVEQLKAINKELSSMSLEIEPMQQIAAAAKAHERDLATYQKTVPTVPHQGVGAGAGKVEPPAQTKTLGEQFTSAPEFKTWLEKGGSGAPRMSFELDVDYKTTMGTGVTGSSAGYAPVNARTGKVVLSAQMGLTIGDLIPQDETTLTAIKFMEETTFTNNAGAIVENDGTGAAESALAFTERTNLVQLIPTFLPVTMQQLQDVPGIQGLINNRLTTMISYVEEQQFITGTGTSPQLTGFLNKAGVQTQALGADNVFDALYKGVNKVRGSAGSGFANPTGIVLHPLNWEPIRLATTADGIYILGNPGEPDVQRLWGLPVVVTTRETQGTGLVGDFAMFSHISRIGGIGVDISDSHSDFFIKFLLAIRAYVRTCLEIYRASAFCKVTSLP